MITILTHYLLAMHLLSYLKFVRQFLCYCSPIGGKRKMCENRKKRIQQQHLSMIVSGSREWFLARK